MCAVFAKAESTLNIIDESSRTRLINASGEAFVAITAAELSYLVGVCAGATALFTHGALTRMPAGRRSHVHAHKNTIASYNW